MKVNSIKTGTIWSMIGQVVNIVFGFIILILTTRFLGPNQYGLLQTILTLTVLSVMVADFGFSSSVARYVAENQNDPRRKSQYIINGLILKMSTSLIIVLLLINVLPFLEGFLDIELEEYSFLLIVITLLRSLREFLLKILQGLRRLDLSTKFNLFYNVGNMSLIATLLYLNFGVNSVLLSEIGITLLLLVIFIFMNKRTKIFSYHRLEKNILKNILIYSVPMFFISMSFYLYMKTDILMVQYFMDNISVGFYSLATMIIGKVHMPMVAIGHATGPALVSIDKNKRSTQLVKVIRVTLLLTLPICMGLFLVSKEFILVFFGSSFLPTVQTLQLLTIFLFFYSVNSVLSPVLDYLGFARKRAIMVGISATLNIFLNMFFIPQFGIVGAVYSTLFTYSIYSIIIIKTVFTHVIEDNTSYLEIRKTFFRIFLASIIMSIFVYSCNLFIQDDFISLILSIFVGITSYILLITKLNIISKSEILTLFPKKYVKN
ncbi:oligosaccharide flippase family protein [Bacillus carboniphilus]|uniref:Oligosaccharide flippase family protein n=1 Tax=Bacillus carboniphilus TaxID=86663 RepID=A0ABY9JTE9_9BACI|nr:oligosaccharide flippase family protein [Bacillus carboniphilus]WLR41568.1 oligosaccharide flippase family protein [Bacillus carboniphilus]